MNLDDLFDKYAKFIDLQSGDSSVWARDNLISRNDFKLACVELLATSNRMAKLKATRIELEYYKTVVATRNDSETLKFELNELIKEIEASREVKNGCGPEYNEDGSEKHVTCHGARFHVVSWDRQGAKCSEPNCEINKRRNEV